MDIKDKLLLHKRAVYVTDILFHGSDVHGAP